MNALEFVDAVRTEVRDEAAEGVISLLRRPSGRRPPAKLLSLSQWFNALSEADKNYVSTVASMASDHATFGFLAVLDGARVIEGSEDRGVLELRYLKRGKSTLLNDPNDRALHELLPHSV